MKNFIHSWREISSQSLLQDFTKNIAKFWLITCNIYFPYNLDIFYESWNFFSEIQLFFSDGIEILPFLLIPNLIPLPVTVIIHSNHLSLKGTSRQKKTYFVKILIRWLIIYLYWSDASTLIFDSHLRLTSIRPSTRCDRCCIVVQLLHLIFSGLISEYTFVVYHQSLSYLLLLAWQETLQRHVSLEGWHWNAESFIKYIDVLPDTVSTRLCELYNVRMLILMKIDNLTLKNLIVSAAWSSIYMWYRRREKPLMGNSELEYPWI